MTGQKISVGAPFFNATFIPIAIPIFLAMPIGQSLAWKRGDLLGAAQRMMVAALAGVAGLIIYAAIEGAPALSYCMAGLAIFVIVGSFVDLGRRVSGRRPRQCLAACARPAALGLRNGGRPRRDRREPCSASRRQAGDRNGYPVDEARSTSTSVGPYMAQLESVTTETRPEFHRDRREARS